MKQKELLLTCLKFINHLRQNKILDEIEIGNTSCLNCLQNIDLFFKLYTQYFGDVNFDIRQEIEKLEGKN